MNNLSKENIDHLFDFVKSKYVRYYDVQLELVDHLASAIEEEMKQKSYLTFEQALMKVYGRFPITGFAKFIIDKEKGLSRFWRKRFWSYLGRYFIPSKIILTLLIALTFLMSAQVSFSLIGVKLNLLYLLMIVFGFKAYYESMNPFLRQSIYGKEKLLTHDVFVEQIGFLLVVPGVFIYVLIQHPQGFSTALISVNLLSISFSFIMAFTVIILHAKATIFKRWIEKEIREKYPEFILSEL